MPHHGLPPPNFQAHVALETNTPFRLISHWTTLDRARPGSLCYTGRGDRDDDGTDLANGLFWVAGPGLPGSRGVGSVERSRSRSRADLPGRDVPSAGSFVLWDVGMDRPARPAPKTDKVRGCSEPRNGFRAKTKGGSQRSPEIRILAMGALFPSIKVGGNVYRNKEMK